MWTGHGCSRPVLPPQPQEDEGLEEDDGGGGVGSFGDGGGSDFDGNSGGGVVTSVPEEGKKCAQACSHWGLLG